MAIPHEITITRTWQAILVVILVTIVIAMLHVGYTLGDYVPNPFEHIPARTPVPADFFIAKMP